MRTPAHVYRLHLGKYTRSRIVNPGFPAYCALFGNPVLDSGKAHQCRKDRGGKGLISKGIRKPREMGIKKEQKERR